MARAIKLMAATHITAITALTPAMGAAALLVGQASARTTMRPEYPERGSSSTPGPGNTVRRRPNLAVRQARLVGTNAANRRSGNHEDISGDKP
jgi:hypothetical protein